MSAIADTYKRTMKAEGIDVDTESFERNNYSLSSEEILELWGENKKICEYQKLTEDQELDSFVLTLEDRGMSRDEAEEVAEIYSRTGGEYFNGIPENEDEDEELPFDEDDDRRYNPDFTEGEDEELEDGESTSLEGVEEIDFEVEEGEEDKDMFNV